MRANACIKCECTKSRRSAELTAELRLSHPLVSNTCNPHQAAGSCCTGTEATTVRLTPIANTVAE